MTPYPRPLPETILSVTCTATGVTREQLLAPGKVQRFAEARRYAARMLEALCDMPPGEIGIVLERSTGAVEKLLSTRVDLNLLERIRDRILAAAEARRADRRAA